MKTKNRSDEPINHPGRNQPLQYFNYHCAAATPPSKGGESIRNELNFNKNPSAFIDPASKIIFKLLSLTRISITCQQYSEKR